MRRLALLIPPALALLVVGIVLVPGLTPTTADEVSKSRALVDERTLEAVEAGFRFLVRTQNPDGSWSSNAGKKINERYRVFDGGRGVHHVGVTSLGILAFLAGGHIPGRGPYGDVLDKAVDFVMGQVQDAGYIASNRTRMYSHAFATLALAEVYGVTPHENLRDRLQAAVEFTVRCQNETGGWRYVPFTKDSDMSVTVCQVVALRAARNVGIKVPRSTINRALHYVIMSANTESPGRGGRGWPRGSFLYQPYTQQYNRDSFSLTAAGLTTLFQAGLYDDRSLARYVTENSIDKHPPPSLDAITRYMRRMYRQMPPHHRNHYFYWYGNYYAMQAMYQIGGQQPEVWADWYRQVRDDILQRQVTDPGQPKELREGWWLSIVDETNAYATASALLILQFPLDQLPIHQR